MSSLDLSHLTPSEVMHIREVLRRAQEQGIGVSMNGGPAPNKPLKSDDVIMSSWSQSEKYQSGWDMVFAALERPPVTEETENARLSCLAVSQDSNGVWRNPKPPGEPAVVAYQHLSSTCRTFVSRYLPPSPHPSPVATQQEQKEVFQAVLSDILDEIDQKTSGASPKRHISITSVSSNEAKDEEQEEKEQEQQGEEEKKEEETKVSPAASHNSLATNMNEEVTPVQEDGNDQVCSAEKNNDFFPGVFDKAVLSVTFTYFPADGPEPRTTCPAKGTRFSRADKTDIMVRKEYTSLTGAKIPVVKTSASGAKEEDENEIHIMVNQVERLVMPSSVIKNKRRTYIKCYMIPDRFHAAKMRSSVAKDSDNPCFHHKFIYRGFKQEEFEKNFFEILVCGLTYSIGKAVVIGGVRLSNTPETSDKSVKGSTEEETSLWKQAFENPGQTISAKIPLRPNFKPTYQ